DADFAREQVEVIKLQILQQTALSLFVQANSSPQIVLSLFQ
ncbi:MAG: flagellin, partial [Candidatus Marinimicrobia bacterium]|nr:flagellin [Candidatus Neomarinimicrobiota bacterium]